MAAVAGPDIFAQMKASASFLLQPIFLVLSGAALISAAPPPKPPGEGVLCLGTFVYFAEKTGQQCRAGQDAAFQERIARHARRFDSYIVRNTGGDPAKLAQFKQSQNLNYANKNYICSGDIAQSYDHLKALKAEELDRSVDELLARDGPPSWGDCV